MVAPSGAQINAREDAVEHLLDHGFTKPKAEAKPERKEEKPKPKRKKA